MLGAHTVHYRNYEYHPEISLKEIIEKKINNDCDEKYIIAVNSYRSYYVFKCKEFSYKILDFLKDTTYANEFIVSCVESDAISIFFEDDTVFIMSYINQKSIEKGFMPLEKSYDIFNKHKHEWKITNYDSENELLDMVEREVNVNK